MSAVSTLGAPAGSGGAGGRPEGAGGAGGSGRAGSSLRTNPGAPRRACGEQLSLPRYLSGEGAAWQPRRGIRPEGQRQKIIIIISL